jgi:DNA (cytosine-5)-methyltransferase 1
MRELRTLDLFAGAGGLSLGFELAGVGFRSTFAVEIDEAAASTYKRNFGTPVYAGPIEDLEEFEPAEVIIGGPPCQGFSPLGRDRDDTSRAEMNELWRQYLRAVRQVQPKAFVIENVPEFQRSAQFETLLQLMNTQPHLKKYSYGFGVLNAADYGVPQRRRRGIFVAVLAGGDLKPGHTLPWPPLPSHGPDSRGAVPYETVRQHIGDLEPMPEATELGLDDHNRQDLHFRRNPRPVSIERYRAIPPGGNRFDLQRNRPDITPDCWLNKPTGTTDVMGRLWWDRPSVTIRTEFFKPEKGRYLHPQEHRPITHREAARIQSFPDSFEFDGTKTEIARQIGNAVPPLLAKAIALHVFEQIERSESSSKP